MSEVDKLALSVAVLAGILTGEASGCSLEARVDTAWVAIHRVDAGIVGGWAAIAPDPDTQAVTIARGLLRARGMGRSSQRLRDRHPETLYAVSRADIESGKLWWLRGRRPAATHVCSGGTHEVILF